MVPLADTDTITSKLERFFSTFPSQLFPGRIIHLLTLPFRYRFMDSLFIAFYKARLESCVPSGLYPPRTRLPTPSISSSSATPPSSLPLLRTQLLSLSTSPRSTSTISNFKSYETITSALPSRTPTSRRFGPHSWRVLPSFQASGAMTTANLCKTDFGIPVAIGADSKTSRSLYVDSGVSINTEMSYSSTPTGPSPHRAHSTTNLMSRSLLSESSVYRMSLRRPLTTTSSSNLSSPVPKNSRSDQKSDVYLRLG